MSPRQSNARRWYWRAVARCDYDDGSYTERSLVESCDEPGRDVVGQLLASVPEPWECRVTVTIDSFEDGAP